MATLFYLVLVTDGIRLGPVPLGLLLTLVTFGLWLISESGPDRLTRYPLSAPALILAVVAPMIWAGVAVFNSLFFDDRELSVNYIAQHGSRFLYILLYFPIYEFFRSYGNRALFVTLIPVAILCLVTISIWLFHLLSGDDMGTTQVLVFKGVIGLAPEGFRVFINNQVMLVLALAVILSRVPFERLRAVDAGFFLLILSTAWLSHTRGIWIALIVVCGTTIILLVYLKLGARAKRGILITTGFVIALAATGWVAVITGAVEGPFGDASTSKRVQQAPELWAEFKANPAFGVGLGGTLASGFVRSEEAPWSFELTYLQILFQMGVAGLVVLASCIGYSVARGIRQVTREGNGSWWPLAGIAAVSGLLVASTTNPYLLSAPGMLILAISFALLVPSSVNRKGKPA